MALAFMVLLLEHGRTDPIAQRADIQNRYTDPLSVVVGRGLLRRRDRSAQVLRLTVRQPDGAIAPANFFRAGVTWVTSDAGRIPQYGLGFFGERAEEAVLLPPRTRAHFEGKSHGRPPDLRGDTPEVRVFRAGSRRHCDWHVDSRDAPPCQSAPAGRATHSSVRGHCRLGGSTWIGYSTQLPTVRRSIRETRPGRSRAKTKRMYGPPPFCKDVVGWPLPSARMYPASCR